MKKEKFVNKLIRIAALFTIAACILSIVPTTAFAASKMKMDKSSKTLYLNEDNSTDTPTKYDFSIKNKPSGYKNKYTFKWYAEDNSIVDVSKGGIVTAKKVGQTTVKCDIKTKSNGKLYTTVSAVVTVKANASSVEITNAPEGNKMQVGETFDFNRQMKNKFGGKATDKTMWVLDCSDGVATIDKNGVVEALKIGTFKLYAKTYQSSPR